MASAASARQPSRVAHVVALALVLALAALHLSGCTRTARDGGTGEAIAVTGAFLADGSCRVVVSSAALFPPTDTARTTYDPGPVSDIAPAGYTLRQLACAPAGTDPALASRDGDERMLLVTLYAREGAPPHIGRYDIRAPLATGDDSAGAEARAGVAVFGASTAERGAGVRYLEGREGTLTITSVRPGANDVRIVGTFSLRARPAWSM